MSNLLLLSSALFSVASPQVFQPGFHQALRWSETSPGRVTYRMKLPVSRAGGRIRAVFRTGDGALTLYAASVARAGSTAPPVPMSFFGNAGFGAGSRQRVSSDPSTFLVSRGEELLVSFEVDGALSASAIELFPGSRKGVGSHTQDVTNFGSPFEFAVGLATLEVEGALDRAFVAIGDSIAEGYVSGTDDIRNSWPAVAERLTGLPVVNAAVSAQGVDDALAALNEEVLSLSGVTDCVVLLGTNDLGSKTDSYIDSRLGLLFSRLAPFCQVWAGTLLPKERTSEGSYEDVKARRLLVNAWLRTRPQGVRLVDFEAVLADPANVHKFKPGLGEDGIHPTVQGQAVMGAEAARVFMAALDAGVGADASVGDAGAPPAPDAGAATDASVGDAGSAVAVDAGEDGGSVGGGVRADAGGAVWEETRPPVMPALDSGMPWAGSGTSSTDERTSGGTEEASTPGDGSGDTHEALAGGCSESPGRSSPVHGTFWLLIALGLRRRPQGALRRMVPLVPTAQIPCAFPDREFT